MDRLWTPWRYQYVTKASSSAACIFCDKIERPDEEGLVVFRGERNFILLNLFPYTNGHMMIAPYEHVATLSECSAEAAAEMMVLTRQAEAVLRQTYKPHGMNLGMNLGESAGAGVVGHIHMHVLPRWAGDANFMTTVSETRVLPEELSMTWKRLREGWRSSGAVSRQPK